MELEREIGSLASYHQAVCTSRRWLEKSIKLQVEAPNRVGQENCADAAANVEFPLTLVLGPKVFLGHEFSVFCLNLKDG